MNTWYEFRKHSCECGGECCSITESIEDKNRAKKKFQSLAKHEGGFRDKMFKLEQAFLADARPENREIAKQLKKLYKDNVTSFMREAAKLTKKSFFLLWFIIIFIVRIYFIIFNGRRLFWIIILTVPR